MRIVTFASGGYIPADDPAVLDRLLEDKVARVRAYNREDRKHQ